MKIGIDIRRMTEFGVGTYIRNVVRALGRLDHNNQYFLMGSPVKVEGIGPLPANFHTVPLLDPENSEATEMRPGTHPTPVLVAASAAMSLRNDGS